MEIIEELMFVVLKVNMTPFYFAKKYYKGIEIYRTLLGNFESIKRKIVEMKRMKFDT